jgi:NADPH-dependent curcumin reductase CurA
VSVLGVASAGTARDIRDEVWKRLSGEWRPRHLDAICTKEVALEDVASVFGTMLEGGSFGRTVVRIGS